MLRVAPGGTLAKLLDLSATSGTPFSIAIDGAGNLYVADTANQILLKLSPPYAASPVVVVSNSVNPPSGGLATLGGIAADVLGNLYLTDTTAQAAIEENYGSSRPHTFARPTLAGRTDTTDVPAAYFLQNIGNATLSAIAFGVAAPADFALVAG